MFRIVEEIPKPNVKPRSDKPAGYYGELIYSDLSDAYSLKLKKFELFGYGARPDYIIQTAKSAAFRLIKEQVYAPAAKYVEKKLRAEFDKDQIKIVGLRRYAITPNQIIKIRGVTLEDGIKHIFCEIDYSYAKNYKKELLELSRERTKQVIEQEKKRKHIWN